MKRIVWTLLLLALIIGVLWFVLQPAKQPAGTIEVRLLSWNIESGGTDSTVIAKQLRDLVGYDIYALQEVAPSNFAEYTNAFGEEFSFHMSETGGSDRLAIGFDTRKFERLDIKELHKVREINLNNRRHRSPLMVRLLHKETGRHLVVMTNHLARSNEELRQKQAIGLREWARGQSVPIFVVGDFNFDYDFHTDNGNEAFREFMRDHVWKWIRPKPLVDTNWYDRNKDGIDDYPDSMLDFTFVAGAAKDFECTSRVIVRDGDFPDDKSTSDHRPVELVVWLPR